MASKTGAIRRQIGPIKTYVGRHMATANNVLDEDVPTEAEELKDYLKNVRIARDNLASAIHRLQEKNNEWAELLKEYPDELHFYDAVCDEIFGLLLDGEEMINKLNANFLDHDATLRSLTSGRPADDASAGLHSANTSHTEPSHSRGSHGAFKAPKIKLPSFSGDYLEFKQFWGIFEANIHNRDDLTNVEKFTYLLSQLEGDAKLALSGILISDDNYDVAVALLKSRFDRADERIITMLYSELLRIPASGRKTNDKQHTLDACERILRQLETNGEDVNQTRSLTVTLLSKFPGGMVRDLQRYYSVGSTSSLKEVRAALSKCIAEEETTSGVLDDLQAMKLPKLTSNDNDQQKFSGNRQNPPFNNGFAGQKSADRRYPQQNTGYAGYHQSDRRFPQQNDYYESHSSALPAMTDRRRQQTPYQNPNPGAQFLGPPCECYFCGGRHFNSECQVYPTAESRLQQLTRVNRCTRCLRRHTPNVPCKAIIKCFHCGTNDDHASAVCHRKFPERTVIPQAPVQPVIPAIPPAPAANSGTNTNPGPSHTTEGNTLQDTRSGGVTALNHTDVKPALFQTAKTTAVNPQTGQHCSVRLAMDTLSSRCYVREATAHKLGLMNQQNEKLFVSVFGTTKTLEVPTTRVEFGITFRDGNRYRLEANTIKVICQSGAIQNDWTEGEKRTLNHFQSSLADNPYDDDGTIDCTDRRKHRMGFHRRTENLYACKRVVSDSFKVLMLAGEAQRESNNTEPTMLCLTESSCQFPSELGLVATPTKFETQYPDIDEFWDLEKIGITDDPSENDDDKALENFQQTVTFEDGRYQVTLPWIEEKRDLLPSNYEIAYDRFRSLAKRLRTNRELLKGYQDILDLQIERGIIEEVAPEEIETENLVHYLPHHPVIKPNSSTTKIRIVYDAASKKNRQSVALNECLLRGPVILPDLCQLLMRMRVSETIVISDIEKAFLQVGLQSKDRDVTRFLWFKDPNDLSLKNNITAYRFTRVNFGVICSPFLLAATIDHHLTREGTEFAETLRSNVYVDNVLSGLCNGQNAIDYYHELKALFNRAGMNIQEFCSNATGFLESIPEQDRIRQTDAKVLGMKWDSQNDDTLRLVSNYRFEGSAENPTKRKVLQTIASVFDPLGFFQPILLPAKCFLQKLWDLRCDWDDPLVATLKLEWQALLKSLRMIFTHRIPRFIGTVDNGATIAVFCDASARAYCTTVYLRCRQPDDSWQPSLIFSKSRLSPSTKKHNKKVNEITLPRLELLGTVIGVRAGQFCRTGLNLSKAKIYFFIDSQCVLHWIAHRGILKRFVANRIEEIRKVVNCEFHYVPTSDNPADFGTRGKLPIELFASDLWWKGPSWLQQDQSTWPKFNIPPVTDEILREIQTEMKPVSFSHTLAVADVDVPVTTFLGIDPNTMSLLSKLVRVSAVCLKFIKHKVWNKLSVATQSKSKLKTLFDKISDDATIDSDDFQTAKLQWVKSAQQNNYREVLDALHGERPTRETHQIIVQLGLQLDHQGLIRTHGRYEHADLPESAREPFLLPKDDRLTILIVNDVHERVMHSGISHTLSQIRQEYWIPHGRAVVRRVLNKCLICRRYKSAKPFRLPPMPPWPRERVERSAPFQNTGLDYFGPITVSMNENKMKMWVCIFTCLAIRAIHLEPVMDFSSQEFLHCLIRFASRRGTPDEIISDNAAQFQLVKILGEKAWRWRPNDESVTTYASNNGIRWKFITELAPWQGGFYERLVGLVKSTLKTSIRRKLLSWTDLVTLLAETEAVVNSRPISYVPSDIDSAFRVIRPNDFLLQQPSSLTDSPDGAEVSPKNFGEAGKRLVSIWKQRCRTLEKLWKHWYDEYVLSLRERRAILHKSGRSDVDKVPLLGQIIMVYDPDAPRGQWKLARITKLITGNDGQIRSAELTLSNGIKLRRPINHMIPLEVENEASNVSETTGVSETTDGQPSTSEQPATDVSDSQPSTNEQQNIQLLHGDDEPSDNTDSTSNDDDEFWGFSPDDVQRTIEALQRFDQHVPDENESVSSE